MADSFNIADQPRISGLSLGSVRLSSQWTMTTAATPEDIPSASVSFTFDGRPVNVRCTPMLTSQDQAAAKLITLTLLRTSDNAVQGTSIRQTDSTANSTVAQSLETGPFTAWPSDGVALVVGTMYTVKLRLTSGASSKASTNANSQPFVLWVATA